MKASELIAELQKIVDKHGDPEVWLSGKSTFPFKAERVLYFKNSPDEWFVICD